MSGILWSWAVSAVVLLALAVALGSRVRLGPGSPKPAWWPLGILIDNRGRMSLNRLQVVLWSLVVISLISGAFFGRLIEGVSDPLGFTIPERVLGLLGISLGTGVTVGAAKASKSIKAEKNQPAEAPPDGKAKSQLATHEATGSEPNFWQVFMLEEGTMADEAVDVTKFQSFAITIVLVVAYVAMAIKAIADARLAADVTALPNISGTFLVLLGISYAGYLGGKLPSQAGTPRVAASPPETFAPPADARPGTSPAPPVTAAAQSEPAPGRLRKRGRSCGQRCDRVTTGTEQNGQRSLRECDRPRRHHSGKSWRPH